MAKKQEKKVTIEKNGNKFDVPERLYRVYYSNLGYKQAKPSGGTTKKSTTKKEGE